MVPALIAHLTDALDEAHKQPKSREMALVITKIEEALHWYHAALTKSVPTSPQPTTAA